MPSNSTSVQERRAPASASNVGCDGLSFTSPSGVSPNTLESHVIRQATLSRQTPYERKHTGFSPGDTGILLGQKDFNATLKRPGVRRFASVRQPVREQQPPVNSGSGLSSKAWDKIRSWGKITFGKGKSGDNKKPDAENGPAGRCESGELGEGTTRRKETGRRDVSSPSESH